MRRMLLSAVPVMALVTAPAWAQGVDMAQPGQNIQEEAVTPAVPANEPAPLPPSPFTGMGVTASDLIGRPVFGEGDQAIGRVTGVILEPATRAIRKLVVEASGPPDTERKRIAVDLSQVQIRPEQGVFITGLKPEDIGEMEELTPDEEAAATEGAAPEASPSNTDTPAEQ